jgi:arginyl-tRNA synthetase
LTGLDFSVLGSRYFGALAKALFDSKALHGYDLGSPLKSISSVAIPEGIRSQVTPNQLSEAIVAALRALVAAGSLEMEVPGEVVVERPKNREHGDWATNVAMQLSAKAGLKPRDFAELLASELQKSAGIEKVEIAGPGFINLFVSNSAAGELAREIVAAGSDYGRGVEYQGVKLNLEFVSANPTGPIHLGGTRWAAVGDSLARLFEFVGAEVTREYYFNDHGAQIDRFARSLLAAAKNEPAPEDGYAGEYIQEIAARVLAETAEDILALPNADAQEKFRAAGVQLMFQQIRESLHEFGVDFDVYFHENSLYE